MCDLTSHGLYCSLFSACTHHSTLQHLPFRCRHFSVLRWKNSRTSRSPTGLHGGITLATQVFHGSQHYIVFNSYNLVRVPRRLHSPCHSHRCRTTQRHQIPRLARSRQSVLLSLIFRWARNSPCRVQAPHLKGSSTVRVSMHVWTSFSTSTDQSHIWMFPLLLLSLTRPRLMAKRAEKSKFDRYPHINLVPFHPRDHRSTWSTRQEMCLHSAISKQQLTGAVT